MASTKTILLVDLPVMIEADKEHLAKAVERGDRTHAHRFVDAIIDNQRQLEDLRGSERS